MKDRSLMRLLRASGLSFGLLLALVSGCRNPLADVLTQVDLAALPQVRYDYTPHGIAFTVAVSGNDSNPGTPDLPLATIAEALARSADGDTVFVRAGTYPTDMLEITRSDFVLAAYPGETVALTPAHPGSLEWNEAMAIQLTGPVQDVVVDGFTISGFLRGGVVYGDPATQRNVILKNLTIQGATDGITNTYPDHTEYLVDGLYVGNVTVSGITGIGIQCGDEVQPCAKNVWLKDVHVTGPGTGDDTAMDALAMVQSDNVLVEDSIFERVAGDGMDFKATRVSVVNSIARHISRNGLKFWKGGEAVNTMVFDTGADAAVVMETGSYRLVNCLIALHLMGDCCAYAMGVGYDHPDVPSSLEITNTIFYGMPGPIYVSPATTLSARNNLFSGFVNDNTFLEYDGHGSFNSAGALNASGFGSGNRDDSPAFVNPTFFDFQLVAGSPAIDAGLLAPGIPSFDILWHARPAGLAPDMGAYER